mmetsp:Transcript_83502/g.236430  ORF Transcript_83502/g.236430 Transcript_83502/m.236430 type:complete len:313 (+) Transcript_83502:30-968(+)
MGACAGKTHVGSKCSTSGEDSADTGGEITDFYELCDEKLGEGSFSSVCRGRHRRTGAERAVKRTAKARGKAATCWHREAAIMEKLEHPNIVRLHETFEDDGSFYLVMDLCEGGELYERLLDAENFAEDEAAGLMQQIFRAICYMHGRHVCHRDLKTQNFLFLDRGPISQNVVKVIDFGISCQFEPGEVLTTKVGTPYFVAPEVLNGMYGHLSDLWSCGVIMFWMLCGYPPFYAKSDAGILSKVRNGSFSFEPKDWVCVSDDARVLVCKLLEKDVAKRSTAEQCLRDEWIRQRAPRRDVALPGRGSRRSGGSV